MLGHVRPYRDELISSAIVRCARHYLLPIEALGRHFLGRTKWHPTFAAIPPARMLCGLFDAEYEQLVWHHSVYPYSTAFMDSGTLSRARLSVMERDRPASQATVVQNGVLKGELRRYCLSCVQTELNLQGESYWHRSHNLPGIRTCHVHGTFLWSCEIPVALASRTPMELPHEVKGRAVSRGRPPDALLDLAQLSNRSLHLNQGNSFDGSPEFYRGLAITNDWLDAGRQVNSARLSGEILSSFGAAHLGRCGLLDLGGLPNWVALMLQPRISIPFTPLKHLILRCVLQRRRPPSACQISHRSSGPAGTADREVDAFYSRQANRVLKQALADQETNLSTETFLRRAGCYGAYRHRKDALPSLRQVVLRFRASVASKKQLRAGSTLFRKRPNEVAAGLEG